MLAAWHFHIEISSKCTLACPRCPRQESPDTLVNTELSLDFFKRNFPADFIKTHVEKLTFCGDDGDPIYAHDFLEVIRYFKSHKDISINIITNGSYKKKNWWAELGSLLTERDQLHFSIDGYNHDSNIIYRVNSNWDSIMTGVNTVRETSNCYMVWDAIGFKFNEDKLNYMISMAKTLGFDMFLLTKSVKFGSYNPEMYGESDNLQPSANLIASGHRFEKEFIYLNDRRPLLLWVEKNIEMFKKIPTINNIKPLCYVGNKGIFINSQGNFFPCCWTANRYNHNSNWIKISKMFNLHENDLISVIEHDFWREEFINNSKECVNKCFHTLVTENYAISKY